MPITINLPSVSCSVCYRDPKAALKWLEHAFGFEPAVVMLNDAGDVMHSEMRFGDGVIMVAGEWSALNKSPRSVDGINTQTVHIQMTDDVDAHCAHARKAGAKIVREPETQFYGDRTYRAEDPEGHVWSFGQKIRRMTAEEWDAAVPGLRTVERI
jgi:uncharacterized glyoxalase superfamily protein PhnB